MWGLCLFYIFILISDLLVCQTNNFRTENTLS
uniref:Uncharacterized protein n=1 Tax=Anguilla anguilla TaxID=7936 RepID=A0A0E9Q3D9_ANGAN